MKALLQPKYILLFIFLIASFFLLRKQFEGNEDILPAGDQSGKVCPVHHIKLKLDVVPIALRKDRDSEFIALEQKYFPLAQDTFYLLQWFQDQEHQNTNKSEVWYCPACREAKKKYDSGELK
jgi:hypothetical protein